MILSSRYFPMLLCFAASALLTYGCIEDDDGIAVVDNLPSMTFDEVTFAEADIDSVYEVTLKLSGARQANGVVSFLVSGGTAEGGLDYEVITKSPLVFTQDEAEKKVTILVKGDEVREAKETIQLTFYNPKNLALGKDILTVSIADDDDNAAGLIIPAGGYTTPNEYPGMTLEWADEFNGESLNPAFWTHETGDGCPNCGWGNQELQYYREDNTSIVDGHLVITAKKQKYANKDYTSSRIVTKGKKVFKYGRIDIRAALPKGQGLWPALWMLGSNIDVVSWPACGEIDIMELSGNLPNRILGTIHYGANTSSHQYKSAPLYLQGNANFQDEFHVFSLKWVADKIEFLVDDVLFYTVTPATLGNASYPFNKNFFFIFNVAVGGTFPGNPDGSTPFPQHMIVDYVRVFK
ncbi:MAG: family 16 glycosylhydrolase [Saprospiraceae bacterium]|nr:family 16 glycosylhydrolase [Saprospiraceae bacterium]